MTKKDDWKQEIMKEVNKLQGSSWNIRLVKALNLAEEHHIKDMHKQMLKWKGEMDKHGASVAKNYEEEISRLKAENRRFMDNIDEMCELLKKTKIRKALQKWKNWNMKCQGDERYNWMESFDGHFTEWLKKEEKE